MNKAYRLIWNNRLNAWVVASELARACGKRSSGRVSTGVAAVFLAASAAGPLAAADLAPGALPTGGVVASGQAAFTTNGNRLDITQDSQRAIINWQGFDIGSQAQVNFAQPNASAVALNRVSGPTATRIEGQLSANGQVFLVNPNGILFGGGARVNVGALVASTLNIRDDDFLAGNYSFSGTGSTIENRGSINAAPGGYLAFIAPKIINSGTINAPQGTVGMGAGERVRLNFAGDRLVGLDVSADTIDTLIDNRQAIRADGGAILLTAAGTEAVTRSVINNTGVLEASSLTSVGGRIVLTAGNDITLGAGSTVAVDGQKGGEITVQAQSGTLLADGSLSVRGAAGPGGSVRLLGNQVGLINAAQVDASGATGGGMVLVGGDYQGGNAAVQNAFRTYVGPQATIKADALQQGDGGRVVVWADDTTRFYGAISARGGTGSGNGGLVETSGHNLLDAQGWVNTLAPLGSAGTWLLDPTNLSITTTANANVNAATPFQPIAAGSVLTWATIDAALAGGNVAVQTTTGFDAGQPGNITIVNPYTYNRANALTFTSANNIVQNVGANIQNNGAGALNFTATGTGTVTFNANIITTNGGVTVTAPGGLTQAAASTTNTGAGVLTVNVGAASTMGGIIAGAGASLVKAGTGTLTLSGNNLYTGATNINAGTLVAANNGALGTAAGATTVASGATLALQGGITIADALTLNGTGVGGGGALRNLSGNNTSSGAVTLGAGGARINSDAGLLTRSGGITGAAQPLTVGGSGNTTITGIIGTTTGTLTKDGAGTLTLSGANTYSGTTTVSGGNLTLSGGSAINNAGAVDLQAGTLQVNTAETIGRLTGAVGTTVTLNAGLTLGDATNTTIASTVGGTGGLTKQGASTVTLSGTNTYTGATTINAGVLSVGTLANGGVASNIGASTNAAANLVLGGGTLQYTGGTAASDRNFTLTAATTSTADVTAAGTNLTMSGASTGTTGALTKAGTGTLTLSGNNLYTGATNINAGTLVAANNGALGTAAGATTVASGATLALQGGITIADALTLNGTGVGGGGALRNLSGNNTSSGAVTLGAGGARINSDAGLLTRSGGITGAAQPLTVGGSGNTTITGIIGTTTGTLTKDGAGTLTLSGANTYSGTTTVSGGNLTLSGGSAINNAGAVDLQAGTLQVNTAETIGRLTGAVGTTVTLNAGLTLGDATNTTIASTVGGTGGLTKQGASTVTLSGTNTYTGATTINAGVLSVGTLANGGVASNIGASTNAAANLVLGGGTLQYTGGTAASDRNFTLTAATTSTADVTAAGTNLTMSGASTGTTGALTKAGTGTLTLSGNNLYTGATNINAGTLVAANNGALGTAAGATTVASGATLALQGGITIADALTLNGTGVGGGGALRNLSGNNTSSGAVTLGAGGARINSDAGLLTRSGGITGAAQPLTVGGSGNTTITGIIGTTTGTLTKDGAGTLTLSGANTYSGTTTVSGGNLTLSGGSAINNAGAVDLQAGTLQVNTAETIGRLTGAVGTTVTLNAGLTLGDATNTTIASTVGGTGGLTKQGASTVTLSGTNTYTGATTINAGVLSVGTLANGGVASNIGASTNAAANLVLGGGTLQYTGGTAASDRNFTLTAATTSTADVTAAGTNLTMSGASTGTTGALTKAGTGTLTLSGNNLYTGATNINAGTLVAANNGALGTAAGATTVASGATLALQGGITIADALTLNGTGVGGGGALRNLSGNNTSSGAVTLGAGGARINSDAGLLTRSGGITGAAQPLTVGGSGNTTITGIIGTTTGTLTKDGAGTLTLSGANTYSGATNINAGTLAVTADNALGTTAAGTTVASGATLDFRNVAYATTEAVTLNGGTLATSTGTSSFAGPVALTAPSSINVSGTQLTLGGAVTAPFALAVAGGGSLTAVKPSNDFSTVSVTSAANVSLRDTNAIDLGTSTIAGNLALTANGAVSDSGALTIGGATAINAGASNDVMLDNANDFGGNVAVQSGRNVRLNDINSLTLDLSTFGTLTATAAGAVTLAGQLAATGTGDAIVLSGGRFVNNAGASALSAPAGSRWLVWSADPAQDTRGGLAYDFKQYGATYPSTPVLGTGNGFLYSLAPTITPTLTGTVSKVYNGTTVATMAAANFTPTSGVDGDVIALSGTGAYDNKNVTGSPTKLVTASSITASVTSSVADGSKPVYGYTLTSTTASANIGAITPLALTGPAIAPGSSVYAAALTPGAVSFGNVVGTDVVTGTASVNTTTLSSSNNPIVGSYTQSASTTLSGTDAGNYSFAGFTSASNYSITPLALSGAAIAPGSSVYAAALTPGAVSFGNVVTGDNVTGTASVNTTTLSSSGNPIVGSYTQSTATTLGGADAANYSFAGFTSASNYSITPLALGFNLLGQGSKVYDGNTTITLNGITPILSGVVAGDAVNLNFSSASGSFVDKNVGTNKPVSFTGVAISGIDSGNYNLSSGSASTTADITPAGLALNAVTGTKVYDGTTTSSGVVGSMGLVTGDTVSGLSQRFQSKNVLGPNDSTLQVNTGYVVNDGNGGANYTVTTNTASGTITPAALALNAVTGTKVYDSTTASSGVVGSTGLVTGDTVNGLSQRFQSKNVLGPNGSTLQVNTGYVVNDGNGGANYTVTTNTARGTITPAALAIIADNADRLANTANPPFSATYVGLVGGETPASLAGTLDFSTPANLASPAGSYPITPFGLTSGNYRISFVDGVLQVITPPVVPPAVDLGPRFDPQAVAAQYSDPNLALGTIPAVDYALDGDDATQTQPGSRVRIIAGGLKVR